MDLKKIEMFEQFNDPELSKIKGILKDFAYKEKEVLCKEGDPGDRMFIITEGVVEIKKKMAEHQAVSLARLLEGEIFGELSFFDDTPRSASVVALSPTKVMVITRKDFMKLLDSDKDIANKLLLWILGKTSRRLRRANEVIRDLTTNIFHL